MRDQEEVRWSRERSIELSLEYYKLIGHGISLTQLLSTTKALQEYINSGNIEPPKKVKVKVNK